MREEATKTNDLGVNLAKQGRLGPAIEFFKKAKQIDPTYKMPDYNLAVSYNNLAKSFNEKGEVTIAKNLLFKSIEAENMFFPAYSNLVDVLMQLDEWETASNYTEKLYQLIDHQLAYGQKSPQTPFLNILQVDEPLKNFIIAKSWEEEIMEKGKNYPTSSRRRGTTLGASKKIKVGYVSDGFRDFPTGHNLLDVIKNHNKKKFEIYLYNHGDNDGSFYRKEFEKLADHFVDMNNWKTADAIQKITDDQIDIFVDLKGHTQGGNLEIFVTHPGKVQISWLGFPGTTGMRFIDYAIVDRVVVPEGEEKYWSEKLIFMPDSYRPVDTGTPVVRSQNSVSREKFGLPEDKFIFSSFNNSYKIEPVMWEVWMNILKRVPNSILWLWERFPEATKNLKKYAKEYGVDPKRLYFTGRLPKAEHLARITLSDLALDTRIVNGHTTTAETIRMGVPVIALYGNHFCSRVSSSILKACNMEELITHSLKEYEELAVKLAKNPKELKSVARRLKANLKTSPLLNTKLFTKNLEKAFSKAFEIYKDGEPPKQFEVK